MWSHLWWVEPPWRRLLWSCCQNYLAAFHHPSAWMYSRASCAIAPKSFLLVLPGGHRHNHAVGRVVPTGNTCFASGKVRWMPFCPERSGIPHRKGLHGPHRGWPAADKVEGGRRCLALLALLVWERSPGCCVWDGLHLQSLCWGNWNCSSGYGWKNSPQFP